MPLPPPLPQPRGPAQHTPPRGPAVSVQKQTTPCMPSSPRLLLRTSTHGMCHPCLNYAFACKCHVHLIVLSKWIKLTKTIEIAQFPFWIESGRRCLLIGPVLEFHFGGNPCMCKILCKGISFSISCDGKIDSIADHHYSEWARETTRSAISPSSVSALQPSSSPPRLNVNGYGRFIPPITPGYQPLRQELCRTTDIDNNADDLMALWSCI